MGNLKEVKALIIAEYYEDETNSQIDYFHSKVIKKEYLGISYSKRNNKNELIKFASNFEETKDIVKDFVINKDMYYCGLPSYFLGMPNKVGWKIYKDSYLDLEYEKYKKIINKINNK